MYAIVPEDWLVQFDVPDQLRPHNNAYVSDQRLPSEWPANEYDYNNFLSRRYHTPDGRLEPHVSYSGRKQRGIGQHYSPQPETLAGNQEHYPDYDGYNLHSPDGELAGTFAASNGNIELTQVAGRFQKRGAGRNLYLLAMHHIPGEWFQSASISPEAQALRARLLADGLIEYHAKDATLVRLTKAGHDAAEQLGGTFTAPGVGFHSASWRHGSRKL